MEDKEESLGKADDDGLNMFLREQELSDTSSSEPSIEKNQREHTEFFDPKDSPSSAVLRVSVVQDEGRDSRMNLRESNIVTEKILP